ncbi:MAG: FAD-linked oxidase C-terminal domain-containing protein [Eubacteriales bacterium]|nr:FAD-linked oxidase C-terminal domain-containing protein [Eubacteriales bacterium]
MPFKRADAADIQYFRNIMLPECVIAGEAINEDYTHDEMTEYGSFLPDAVLLPRSTEEVSHVMRYCYEKCIAVTPRGAGTGLCGGCVALHGGVVLSLQDMKSLLEVDKINMTATVEPGLLLMEFSALLEGTGLFYPPDPGEKSATVCGNIMTNAGGMRAVRYGVTKDYVLGMEVVLADGTVMELGGKVVKSSSGYNLMQLLCGSEGTLCVLTKATVKLIPEPKANVSLLVPFDSLDMCVSCVPDVLACGCEPTAVEFMEKEVIVAAESYLGKQFPDKSANAYLLVRLDGADEEALEPRMQLVTNLLLQSGARDVLLADTDERKTGIWDARGAFLEAIKNSTPSMDECDVVVPRENIAEFVRNSRDVSRELAVRIRSFGHAGDGNLHLYVCKDALDDETWEDRRAQTMGRLYILAKTMGGHVSGEHGIGHAKVEFLRESAGPEQMALMRGIKSVFDPKGILNPGKVVG